MTKVTTLLRSGLFPLLSIFFPFIMWAQGTATVVGVVKDSTAAVIPGVQIKLLHKTTGAERDVTSNESGIYTAELLLIGEYRVEASKAGFKTFIQDGLILNTGD